MKGGCAPVLTDILGISTGPGGGGTNLIFQCDAIIMLAEAPRDFKTHSALEQAMMRTIS